MNVLKDELEEKNSQLHKAGLLGKDLMCQIEELEYSLQSVTSTLHEKEAEVYDNERRLQLKDDEVTALKSESELIQRNLEEKIKLRLSQKERQLEKEHQSHCDELTENISQLQAQLARCSEKDVKMKETNAKLSDEILQLKEELLTSTGAVADVSQQDKELTTLRNTVQHLTKESSELQNSVELYKSQIKSLGAKNQTLAESIERLECESTTHFNLTQEQKTQIIDLQMELDIQKVVEPQQTTNGNSLFAEVDDRRRRLEKENRIYKGKYKSLDESYKHLLVSRDRIKNELLAVYARSEALTVDSNRLLELEKCVYTQNKEVKQLTKQVHDSKKRQAEIEAILDDYEYSPSSKPTHRIDGHRLQRDNKKLTKDIETARNYQKLYKMDELMERDHRVIIEKDLYNERKRCTTEYQKGVTLQIRADELESLYKSSQNLCKTLEDELERSSAAQAKGLHSEDFLANFSMNESYGCESTHQIMREIDGPGGPTVRLDELTTQIRVTPVNSPRRALRVKDNSLFDEPTTKIVKTPLRSSENSIRKLSPQEELTTKLIARNPLPRPSPRNTQGSENIRPVEVSSKEDKPEECPQQ